MDQILKTIRDNPHRLGHWLGYTKLTDIHSEWIKYCFKTTEDRAMQAHRGTYKTTAVLVVGSIWYLLFNPEVRILINRKESTGAQSILYEITQHYIQGKMDALYSLAYGDKLNKLVKKSNMDSLTLSTKTQPTKEGNIEAIGVGGASTGRHYDIILNDDIITIKDRVSRAEREKTKIFIQELKNIVNPDGHIVYTGTPWHKEDGWNIIPEPIKYPIGSLNLPHVNSEYITDLRDSMTTSLYDANYRLVHTSDETRLFPEPEYGEWPNGMAVKMWIDPAYSGKNNTSLTLLGSHNNKWYASGYTWRRNIIDLYSDIVRIAKQYNCGTIYIESNADKGLSARDLKHMYPAVVERHEKENKHNKIIGYAVQHFRHLIWDKDTQPEYMSNLIDYQEGEEPDDEADSLASLLRECGFSSNINAKVSKVSAASLGL